jgi:hypothetical protein
MLPELFVIPMLGCFENRTKIGIQLFEVEIVGQVKTQHQLSSFFTSNFQLSNHVRGLDARSFRVLVDFMFAVCDFTEFATFVLLYEEMLRQANLSSWDATKRLHQ